MHNGVLDVTNVSGSVVVDPFDSRDRKDLQDRLKQIFFRTTSIRVVDIRNFENENHCIKNVANEFSAEHLLQDIYDQDRSKSVSESNVDGIAVGSDDALQNYLWCALRLYY